MSANVRSWPSDVTARDVKIAPALLMSTSSLSKRARTWPASARTDSMSDRSAKNACAGGAPAARSSSTVASALARSRATRITSAPRRPSSTAVARPSPVVAPVTSTRLPASARSTFAALISGR
jgi:hypothetical protein